MIYALDTNAVSDLISGRGRVSEQMKRVSGRLVGIPAPVVFELECGAAALGFGSKRFRQLSTIISAFQTIAFDRDAAKHSADIEATLRGLGQPIGIVDVWIAGVARSRGLILVTHNTREFSRVPSLQIEDWH